jgi:hypothetical protein
VPADPSYRTTARAAEQTRIAIAATIAAQQDRIFKGKSSSPDKEE